MKFTIVSISYNQAEFLERAISSVIEQDYPNIEYIVVDPGSTDGSREIIQKYRHKITHVILERDNGPADGLNKGFSLATGDILGFINSDDFLLPGSLKEVARKFVENKGIDVISGHGYVVNKNGDVVRRIYSDKFNLKRSAYGACILIQPSTFFSMSSYKASGGFNTQNRSNWDSELFIDMALAGANFMTIDKMLSAYRIHSESITGTARLRHLHKTHRHRMFTKVFNRDPTYFDRACFSLLSYFRKVTNLRDTYERIMRGPVFGSSSRE